MDKLLSDILRHNLFIHFLLTKYSRLSDDLLSSAQPPKYSKSFESIVPYSPRPTDPHTVSRACLIWNPRGYPSIVEEAFILAQARLGSQIACATTFSVGADITGANYIAAPKCMQPYGRTRFTAICNSKLLNCSIVISCIAIPSTMITLATLPHFNLIVATGI